MIEWYKKLPTMFLWGKQQNILIWLEECRSLQAAKDRFEELIKLTKQQRIELIESGNPQWVELKPGENITL